MLSPRPASLALAALIAAGLLVWLAWPEERNLTAAGPSGQQEEAAEGATPSDATIESPAGTEELAVASREVVSAPDATDTETAENELLLTAAPVPKSAPGIFFLGPTQVNQSFGNGTRCVGGSILRLAPVIADYHVLSQRVDLTVAPLAGNVIPGSTWNIQAWFRDVPAGRAFFNTSSAISIVFEP